MEFQDRINSSSANQQESALPLLFVARMMVIFLLWIRGLENILPPFLPFFEGLNILRGQNWLFTLVDWVYWISLVLVFTGFRFRFFSLLLAALVFFSIICSKPQFSNSFLYSGCILFLIGIHKSGLNWIFHAQISMLYLGAGFNKLFDPDWLSGQYFDYFFSTPYRNLLYLHFSSMIPGNGLAMFLSCSTILIELGLGTWALIQKKRSLLVLCINFFHLSMLLMTAGELSYIFYFLMAVSSYLILPWEEMKGYVIRYNRNSRLFISLKFFDFDHFLNWEECDPKFFLIQKKLNRIYLLWVSLLFNKFLFGFLVLFLVFICRYKFQLLALF